MMSADIDFPIDTTTAHEVVRAHLHEETDLHSSVDPRMAACACLRNGTPASKRDAAAFLAAVAEKNTRDVVPALYDLTAVLDASDRRTRVYAMGAFECAARRHSETAIKLLDPVIARLSDVDPLVREAAASTIAWLANAAQTDHRTVPDGTHTAFRPAVAPLCRILAVDRSDPEFEWTTAFAVPHPMETFWGRVEADADRRSEGRWQASFAVALLAEWFPESVRAYTDTLATLARVGTRTETRWYATDALARAGADETLREIRDQAQQLLTEPARTPDGIETLYHIVVERPELIAASEPALASVIPELHDETAALAGETLLRATVHDPTPPDSRVLELVQTWLRTDDSTPPTDRFDIESVARIAAAHPEAVLPVVSRALNGSPIDVTASFTAGTADGCETTRITDPSWDTARAWQVLVAAAAHDRDRIWKVLDDSWIRARLDERTDRSEHIRTLYATGVSVPPATDALTTLIQALVADRAGAYAAVSTLIHRAPESVVTVALDVFEDARPPHENALSILATLSADDPAALAPLISTCWGWNDTIQPGDDRWSDLVTILGRIVVATDDRERLAGMLHLEHTVYAKLFLETSVAPAVIQAAPTNAIPPLLEHLEYGGATLQEQIIRTFTTLPGEYDGWDSTIRDAILELATASNWRVRAATVEVAGDWLAHVTEDVDAVYDDWLEPIQTMLIDRLTDADRRVRRYAVRSLAVRADSTMRAALQQRLSHEPAQPVRFEIQRVHSYQS